jgi:hypothetical protein
MLGALEGYHGVLTGFEEIDNIEDVFDEYEILYVVYGLGKALAPGGRFKCIRGDCFSDGTLHHSLMLSLLCRKEVEEVLAMSGKYRETGVPGLHKRGRPANRSKGERKDMDSDSTSTHEVEPKVNCVIRFHV